MSWTSFEGFWSSLQFITEELQKKIFIKKVWKTCIKTFINRLAFVVIFINGRKSPKDQMVLCLQSYQHLNRTGFDRFRYH